MELNQISENYRFALDFDALGSVASIKYPCASVYRVEVERLVIPCFQIPDGRSYYVELIKNQTSGFSFDPDWATLKRVK